MDKTHLHICTLVNLKEKSSATSNLVNIHEDHLVRIVEIDLEGEFLRQKTVCQVDFTASMINKLPDRDKYLKRVFFTLDLL